MFWIRTLRAKRQLVNQNQLETDSKPTDKLVIPLREEVYVISLEKRIITNLYKTTKLKTKHHNKT